jgi:hypothetical protein
VIDPDLLNVRGGWRSLRRYQYPRGRVTHHIIQVDPSFQDATPFTYIIEQAGQCITEGKVWTFTCFTHWNPEAVIPEDDPRFDRGRRICGACDELAIEAHVFTVQILEPDLPHPDDPPSLYLVR